MNAWVYFHDGQLLGEFHECKFAEDLPDNTYLFNKVSRHWAHITTKPFLGGITPVRGFHDITEDKVPAVYKTWLLLL